MTTSRRLTFLAGAVALIVVLLGWLGYRATIQWRNSATIVAERRADEIAALLMTALTKDMMGAQQVALLPIDQDELNSDFPYDLAERIARAFARFPYPESFILWQPTEGTAEKEISLLFSRTDRLPPWQEADSTNSTFPVIITRNSSIASSIAALARHSPQTQVALFQTTIQGTPYQVIARLFHHGGDRKNLAAIVAFTVNLTWIRNGYFPDLISQIERVSGSIGTTNFSMAILDEHGNVVAQNRPPVGDNPSRERPFALAFFDSSTVSVGQLQHLTIPQWTSRVNTAGDALLAATDSKASTSRALILFGTLISLTAIAVTLRSFRSNLELTAIRSDFVAMASHELKTPLVSIRLVAETLLKNRYSSREAVHEYAAVLSKESHRLTRLVDNLLTFSRITAPTKAYTMTPMDINNAVSEALEAFQPQIEEKAFQVAYEIADQIPIVSCDRSAITQVFENVIENAIKYSDQSRKLAIRVWQSGKTVNISFKDSGRGIRPSDLPHVFDRFFRGGNAGASGSGLGLVIARTIVEDHGGKISIESVLGEGALVSVTLPALEDETS